MITLHLNSLLRTLKSYDLKALYLNLIISNSISREIEWQIGTFDDHALSLIWLINCSQTKRNGIKLLVFC